MRVMAFLFILALAGCMDDAEPAPVERTPQGAALADVVYQESGTIFLGAYNGPEEGGACGGTDTARNLHSWSIPTEDADGVPQTIRNVTILLNMSEEGDGTYVDLDLFIYSDQGTLLGSSTDGASTRNQGEAVTLLDLRPQELTLDVRGCIAADADYVLNGLAQMEAAQSWPPAPA